MSENATIEQAQIQSWQEAFYIAASQSNSHLSSLPGVKSIVEINEITGRNPKITYDEEGFTNRQIVKKDFVTSFMFDKYDNIEMLTDPTTEVYEKVMQAFNVQKDRIIAEACFANVVCGDPNNGIPLTTITAEEDGVRTIDATGGLTYNVLKQINTNFINSNVIHGDLMNSNLSFVCAGSDMAQLLDEEKFINNNYTTARPVDNGFITKVLGMNVVTLAGSQTNYIELENPILKEEGTTRDCIVMAPDAIRFVASDFSIKITEPGKYYRSKAIVFSARLGAIRTEGAKIQRVKTTF